jgi:hypothetical protein
MGSAGAYNNDWQWKNDLAKQVGWIKLNDVDVHSCSISNMATTA